MAVNNLDFNQLSTVLASITQQATGQAAITATNTADFISIGQRALAAGYDKLNTAISQVLGKTLFSVRPYNRKFAGLQASEQRWGAITRKLAMIDDGFSDDTTIFKPADPTTVLADGDSVDPWVIKKAKTLELNFYGANVYQKQITVYKHQLDTAFSNPEDFGAFLSMQMQNASDQIEQAHEATARMIVANLIGGVIASNNTPQVIHLLTEYNAKLGLTGDDALTAESVYLPANFAPFMRWVYARVKTLSSMFTERTAIYHTNVTGNTLMRHTPVKDQRLYLFAPAEYETDANVIATTYNDKYLAIGEHESVNFWQSIQTPDTINVKPVYLSAAGEATSPNSAITQAGVFGVLMDVDAAGYTVANRWSAATPLNARGGYSNYYWHFTDRYWNDFTENAVVFLLD